MEGADRNLMVKKTASLATLATSPDPTLYRGVVHTWTCRVYLDVSEDAVVTADRMEGTRQVRLTVALPEKAVTWRLRLRFWLAGKLVRLLEG